MKRYGIYAFFVLVAFSCVVYVKSRVKSLEKNRMATDVALVAGQSDRQKLIKTEESQPAAYAPSYKEVEFSQERKDELERFVNRAAKVIEKNELSTALSEFSKGKAFKKGEFFIFVFDFDGVCLAHGLEPYRIWQNMYNYKDSFGFPVVQEIIRTAREKGEGWLSYESRNTTKASYIKRVEKDGKKLAIGAGYYPISKRDAVVNLVKEAVGYFNATMKQIPYVGAVFGVITYPLGRFVKGDLYLFALDFNGVIWAQGERPGLVGQNALNYRDAKGKFANREIIDKLRKADEGEGVWTDYISKGALKKVYSEKVTDRMGKSYFISSGYYPDSNRKEVIDLVRKGYTYMKANGITEASKAFSTKEDDSFRYGDLWLFVYDYQGKCIAHGKNSDYVGRNRYDAKGQGGDFFVREFIQKAKAGGGWTAYKTNNAYRFAYVEPLKIAGEDFVIGSGYFPISKPETMKIMVKSAVSLLKTEKTDKALEAFVKKSGEFTKGDLGIFVYDYNGICYAYGTDYRRIWGNYLNAKDEDGRPYVKLFINTAKEGGGNVIYKEKGQFRTSHVLPVEKDGKKLVVGSGFFINK